MGGGWCGTLCQVKTESAKICLDFNFRGEGGGWWGTLCQVKTQSAKISLDFNFRGEGGGWVGGWWGTLCQVKTQSAKICLDFYFRMGGWWGTLCKVKTQSAKICLNFNFRGGGIFEPNFQPLQLATASQIVSHILRMWRLINLVCDEDIEAKIKILQLTQSVKSFKYDETKIRKILVKVLPGGSYEALVLVLSLALALGS